MSLRVISGSARGRKLKPVPGDSTRPIMDRAKEALFSIIGDQVWDTVWLDLFAGTGSVGIEALSRGAAEVLFVDLERSAIKIIHDNLRHTDLDELAIVRQLDAFALIKRAPQQIFDYIYIAPPQYQNMWKDILLALEENPAWIPEGTYVIVQIDPREYEELPLHYLEEYDTRKYGKTMFVFYESQFQDSTD